MTQNTMKALVYHGPNQISLDDVPVPKLEKPTDVIGKVTVSAICTSDVHIAAGHIPFVQAPRTLGHEFCMEIVEVGSEVKKFKVGQHVHVAPQSSCGTCPECLAGFAGHCRNGGGFGIFLDGCQAEYIRVPNAENSMYAIPDGLTDEDVLLVGDMLATAYFGITRSNVTKGQTVAVMGLGPVGFSACLLLEKAFGCHVIAITRKQESLDLAMKQGVAEHTVNAADPDMIQKVMALTGGRGVDAVIETGGSEQTFNTSCAITKIHGNVSAIAVYAKPITIPIHQMIYKNLNIHIGMQQVEGLPELMNMVKKGIIDPKFMLTHHAPLNDILKGYDVFGRKADGCIKWVVTPYER